MALVQMFAWIKKHQCSRLVFDTTYPYLSDRYFCRSEFYNKTKETIPTNAPETRLKGVNVNLFVDSIHARSVLIRMAHPVFIIFIGRAPVICHSKRQNNVDSAIFGAEFVALKKEIATYLRYKLWVLVVRFEGNYNVFSKNKSVCVNYYISESTLKNK